MARVRPFTAWRYAQADRDLSAVTAPPYDVISEEMRAELLARDDHNVVALELPEGPLDPSAAGNRYATGKATWDAWRAQGVLRRDDTPAVYVLEQRYRIGERDVRRRAFIAEVGLEPFEAGVVLPHERTLPKALGDRFNLISATGANLSQVLGLYEDERCATDDVFDAVRAIDPIAVATDADGVESVLWALTDRALLDRLAALMASSRIFIADGHHRYTTALAYRDTRRAEDASSPAAGAAEHAASAAGEPARDFVMMALVNMDDPDLVVMPTHRVADAAGAFDAERFLAGLGRHFDVTALPSDPHSALAAEDRASFVIAVRGATTPLLARLRADVDLDDAIALDRSSAWKHLDVAVIQELVLWPLLGIHPDEPATLERLSFVKDAHAAMRATAEHDVAIVMRATRMDQLRAVAVGGETMPQKSTYFYPKLLSGLVFRSAE